MVVMERCVGRYREVCWLQQEELSEQQVRVGLLEKKLENATRDTSGQLEKVQQKLDVAGQQLKQKQK